MANIYYELLLREKGEKGDIDGNYAFRKKSPFPFPLPIGTSYDPPVIDEALVFVCGYSHEMLSTGEVLYILFGRFGEVPEKKNPFYIVDDIELARTELLEDGWEELDLENEPIFADIELRNKQGVGAGATLDIHITESGELVGTLTFDECQKWMVTSKRDDLDWFDHYEQALRIARLRYGRG